MNDESALEFKTCLTKQSKQYKDFVLLNSLLLKLNLLLAFVNPK